MKKEFTLRLDDAACAELENLKKLNSKAIIYYVSDEVHEDKEAAKEFLKSRRKEKKE